MVDSFDSYYVNSCLIPHSTIQSLPDRDRSRSGLPWRGATSLKKSCQGTVHTVTSLLGRNEEEAPVTTAAPYAIDSMLTQSQNTYQEHHSTCKAIFQGFFNFFFNMCSTWFHLRSGIRERKEFFGNTTISWVAGLWTSQIFLSSPSSSRKPNREQGKCNNLSNIHILTFSWPSLTLNDWMPNSLSPSTSGMSCQNANKMLDVYQ